MIAIGYIVTTILIFAKPNNVIPYYIILVGTVAIIRLFTISGL